MVRLLKSHKIDWRTIGNQSSYLDFGNIRICWGITANISVGGASGVNHIQTLPASFANSSYTVVASMNTRVDSFDHIFHTIIDKTSTSFGINFYNNSGSGVSNFQMNWVAIGQKAS